MNKNLNYKPSLFRIISLVLAFIIGLAWIILYTPIALRQDFINIRARYVTMEDSTGLIVNFNNHIDTIIHYNFEKPDDFWDEIKDLQSESIIDLKMIEINEDWQGKFSYNYYDKQNGKEYSLLTISQYRNQIIPGILIVIIPALLFLIPSFIQLFKIISRKKNK
jgi:hypothetical protein